MTAHEWFLTVAIFIVIYSIILRTGFILNPPRWMHGKMYLTLLFASFFYIAYTVVTRVL